MNQIKAVGDNIILEVVIKKKTESGLVLANEQESNIGTIVAIGEELAKQLNLKVGDNVYFKKSGVHEVEIDGKQYLSVPSKRVLCQII